MLSAAGAAVSDSALARLAWGPSPPDDGFSSLRVLVSRLRSVFGPAERELLQRAESGYRLAVPVESTDHGRFARLVADGGKLLGDGAAVRAALAFESALLLWRGQPWVDEELSTTTTCSASRRAAISPPTSLLSDCCKPLSIMLIAFVILTLVGVTAGMWPALKAAQMQPVEALRCE